ncbi:MAG: type 4a pilus biogenesis protein PilO [Patescibacteria group bacterium]
MNNKKIYNLLRTFGVQVSTLLVLVIILAYIVLPSIKHINELSNQIFAERTKLEELYLKGQSLKRSTEEYRKIKNEISELENIFINEEQELNLITQLETLASETNVKQELNIKENEKNTDNEKMYIALNIRGQYTDIIKYIEEVEALDLYINFDKIRFSKNAQGKTRYEPTSVDPINPTISLILDGYVNYWISK